MKAETPMMAACRKAKETCPDAVLLFRIGDFFEAFDDDAKRIAAVLGLALTSRGRGEDAWPMAGFPHHQLHPYLEKLVKAGLRVAVCEPCSEGETPKGTKVERHIVRMP